MRRQYDGEKCAGYQGSVISYAAMTQEAHLKGLVLIDGSLFPVSPDEWNKHRSRNYNIDNWLDNYMPLVYDRDDFYERFVARISNGAMTQEDREWVMEEFMKTPPWSALEFHYDFCHTDNYSNLKKLTVPVSIFGGRLRAGDGGCICLTDPGICGAE